jgi:peptide/nickel transport system ATP-binding protein
VSAVIEPALLVNDLWVRTDAGSGVVEGVSFTIDAGEVLGLVGESGCGKTTVGLALLGYCRLGLRLDGGSVRIADRDLLRLSPPELKRARGRLVAFVPQDPATAMNPALRIRTQLAESLQGRGARERIAELLEEVSLPASVLGKYPHQLSGGQQQRVAIAMAFANHPRVVVMDEPTTGLDVTTQAHVLETVRRLSAHYGLATLYISHDLAVVASLADRVAVMYAGRIVELGATARVLGAPEHPYTRALIRAVPDVSGRLALQGIPGHAPEPGQRPGGCTFAPRCPVAIEACSAAEPSLEALTPGHFVRCIRPAIRERIATASPASNEAAETTSSLLRLRNLVARHGRTEILHGVSLNIPDGTCVALVGESGSGKTTLARCVVGLHRDLDGEMTFRGEHLPALARVRPPQVRRSIQYVFQNPYASLNPRRTISHSIGRALHEFEPLSRTEVRRRVLDALDQVALPASMLDRYPHGLSGGQRQRVAIARALVTDPDLLICDEVTSSLDVSVQAVIVELLERLQRERGLAMLFVTHNLALVRSIAQQVAVMRDGQIVEFGAVEHILETPKAEETKRLLADTPRFAGSVGRG